MKLRLFLCVAISFAFALDSCLVQNQPAYGGVGLGTPISDYPFLYSQESNDYSFAMSSIELCTNSTGALIGLRATVAKVDKSTKKVLST